MSYILRCNDNKFVISLSFIIVVVVVLSIYIVYGIYGALGQMQNNGPIQMLSQ